MRVNLHGVPKVAKVVVVAVTERFFQCLFAVLCILYWQAAAAAVLDDDRIDVLYQTYDGGGTEVQAPAVVVRKKLAESFSLSGSYLVDMVSGASIDVEVGASAYEEERTEYAVGMQYLKEKATLSVNYSNSSENDYQADTYNIGITQDFFGDLSTISFGLGFGQDEIGQTGAPSFSEQAKSYQLDLGWTQIITRSFIANISFNKSINEGYLQNPYRFIRYIDPANPTGWLSDKEQYPETRSSDAWSIRGRYFLPGRHVIYASYRMYQDTWGIQGRNAQLGYTFVIAERWTFDAALRIYRQTAADFYRDIFDYPQQFNHMARDKELSRFSNRMFSTSAAYELPIPINRFIKKSSVHFFYDYIEFDYDNFRDARVNTVDAGKEPLYGFSANLFRLMISVWF